MLGFITGRAEQMMQSGKEYREASNAPFFEGTKLRRTRNMHQACNTYCAARCTDDPHCKVQEL